MRTAATARVQAPRHEDWTETHRPVSLDQVAGNRAAVQDLRAWAKAWTKGRPEQPGIILAGPPGVGKTSAALALAQEMGWGIVELNASDQRNRDAVQRVATAGSRSGAFTVDGSYLDAGQGKLKLILLDEADALHGRDETVGGLRAIVDALRHTQQPIALIANDLYGLTRRSSALKDLCLIVKFRALTSRDVARTLAEVLTAEEVAYDPDTLLAIAEQARGDLRGALRDVQALAEGTGRIGAGDAVVMGARDRTGDLWGLVGTVLRTRDPQEARRAAFEVDEEPRDVLTWVEDNMPAWYTAPEDRARAFDALSRADIFLARTMRTQQYRLWRYATDLMTAGVALSKSRDYRGARLGFPAWIRRMGATRHARAARNGIAKKAAKATHTSSQVARETHVPMLQAMFQHAPGEAAKLAAALELEEPEVSYLLGRPTKAQLRNALELVEAARAAREGEAGAATAGDAAAAEETGDEDGDEEGAPVEEVAPARGKASGGGKAKGREKKAAGPAKAKEGKAVADDAKPQKGLFEF